MTLILGPSGAGKSTLVNSLVPNARALTGEISQALNSGKHTTTSTSLYWVGDRPDFSELAMQGTAIIDQVTPCRCSLSAAAATGFAHSGTCPASARRCFGVTIRRATTSIRRRGCGTRPIAGSAGAELSNSLSAATYGRIRTRFSRPRSNRSRILATGMSWPPCATRCRTRSMCISGVASPMNQTLTVRPASHALSNNSVMVRPPSVVSKAKSRRSRIARSSRRLPSAHAAPLACAWENGVVWADRMAPAASSGLKYAAPAARSAAPPMLLLPAPLQPART